MNLDQLVKQRLERVTAELNESAKACAPKEEKTGANNEDEVVTNPKKKTVLTKESLDGMTSEQIAEINESELDDDSIALLSSYKKPATVSEGAVPSQISDLLNVEGLTDDFKVKAVTIFEAAVADRVLQIEERMKTEFDEQLAEAVAEVESDIDGFVTEAVKEWQTNNEVAIKQNFRAQVNEALVDGLMNLLAEHNVDLEPGKEDALAATLSEVARLEESVKAAAAEKLALQEQVNSLTAASILESFRSKMTQTEFDRFGALVESVEFTSAEQYTKQLSIVLENFGVFKNETPKIVTEVVDDTPASTVVESVTNSNVNQYAKFIASRKI